MDEFQARVLEVVFIAMGVSLRTALPAIRKFMDHKDVFKFDWTWIGTAVTAFLTVWYVIVMTIPVQFDPIGRIVIAFGMAFFGNSLINEIAKWEPIASYIKIGEK